LRLKSEECDRLNYLAYAFIDEYSLAKTLTQSFDWAAVSRQDQVSCTVVG